MKILRLYALVDIARYQSNFSEWEGKKVRWERVVVVVWDQGIAFFYMISEDYFLNIPEKSYKDVNNIWYNVQQKQNWVCSDVWFHMTSSILLTVTDWLIQSKQAPK